MNLRRVMILALVGVAWPAAAPTPAWSQVWRVPLRDVRTEDRDAKDFQIGAECVEFFPDGKTLAAAGFHYHETTRRSRGEVRLYNVADGALAATLTGTASSYAARAGTLAISNSGKWIAAAGRVTRAEGKVPEAVIDLFDAAERKLVRTLAGDKGSINWVCFSPDEKTLLAARYTGPVEVWDLESGECTATFCDHASVAVFSPDGKVVATRGNDGKAAVMFWRIEGKDAREVGRIPAVEIDALSIAFSPDGKLLAAAGIDKDGSSPVYVWELSRPERDGDPIIALRKVRLTGHREATYSVAFSPDGKWLVSANQDNTARLWSMETMTEAAVIPAHRDFVYDAAFSPDGTSLVTLGRDAMMLWELKALLRGK